MGPEQLSKSIGVGCLSVMAWVGAVTGAREVEVTAAFEGADAAAWTVSSGEWRVENGGYEIQGTGQTFLVGPAFDDMTVEVQVLIRDPGKIPADWVGFVLRGKHESLGQGYLLYLRYNGSVELYRDGLILAAAPTDAPAAFARGEAVTLKAEAQGARFRAWVDGRLCFEHEDDAVRWGEVGLATYDVTATFDDFHLSGHIAGNAIEGVVLRSETYLPAPNVPVEIYHSMDGYNSPVTRAAVTDARGRFLFTDLPPGEKAYWLRTGQAGTGGTTAWFVTVA
jgi:hypothetical protein